jgi:RNA polymerase primary sigma factor
VVSLHGEEKWDSSRRRYGLDDRDPPTLAELAAELELSRERVRQLQREAEFLLKSGTRRVPRRAVA